MKNKNGLDEMQQIKLMQIEHKTLMIMMAGLIAAMMIQNAVWISDGRLVLGESIVLMISSLYMLVACIKNGIWERKSNKPSLKRNIVISVIVSFVFGVFWAIVSFVRYKAWQGSLASFAFIFIFMFVLLMIAFSISSAAYMHKVKKMEQLADKEEQEL